MAENNPLALENAKEQNPDFDKVKIKLPGLTFDTGTISLQIGKRHVKIFATPGNSPDGISVLVREDRVLFAGDAFLPLPTMMEGDIDELSETIKNISKMSLENIVQGHGDVVLRGEIESAIKNNLDYLATIRKIARKAARRKNPLPVLEQATVEECGKSRVLLGGLVEELHQRNLALLYKQEIEAKSR
jgi:glyoxylase-like metal-dependent hydrolase (beta-lactamase superfamily II)